MHILRRTFSRRGYHRPTSSTTSDGRISSGVAAESGSHIPAPEGYKSHSLITVRVIMLDGTDVSVDVHVSVNVYEAQYQSFMLLWLKF